MTLPKFLKIVDNDVAEMSRDMLIAFIHKIAKELSVYERDKFLDAIHAVKVGEKSNETDKFYSEIEKAKSLLSDINEEKRCLEVDYSVDYRAEYGDYWYEDEENDEHFLDPERLLPDIKHSIALLHKCIDMERYKEGKELAEILSTLVVYASDEDNAWDDFSFGIGDLCDRDLLDLPFRMIVLDSLFLTYMGSDSDSRAEALFRIMKNYDCFDVKLVDIMTQSENCVLPGLEEFLSDWFEYLASQPSFRVESLLQEAQWMVKDERLLFEMASKFADMHPQIYRQLLESGLERDEDEKMLKIGTEALKKIPVTYIIRSEIALLTAEYARRLDRVADMEYCWIEAFRSDTSVVNYMRLRFDLEDWNQHKDQVKQIYQDEFKREKAEKIRGIDVCMQSENYLSRNSYYTILFFEMEFENVIQNAMNVTEALGWSTTFMKEGLALFLLLLYTGDDLPLGIESMLSWTASSCTSKVNNITEIVLSQHHDAKELFWTRFNRWKKEVSISERICNKWLQWIGSLLEKRIKVIMEEQHRVYYRECAEFIAAYGEVKESRGEENARVLLMEKYKNKYHRFRNFRKELRDLGLKC